MDASMLPYFRELRTIEGALHLNGNDGAHYNSISQMVSLVGLFPNLVNVTGELVILGMGHLLTLDGTFPALEYVSDVTLQSNNALAAGNPFPRLKRFTSTTDSRTRVNALVAINGNYLLTCATIDEWFGSLENGCSISTCSSATNQVVSGSAHPDFANGLFMSASC